MRKEKIPVNTNKCSRLYNLPSPEKKKSLFQRQIILYFVPMKTRRDDTGKHRRYGGNKLAFPSLENPKNLSDFFRFHLGFLSRFSFCFLILVLRLHQSGERNLLPFNRFNKEKHANLARSRASIPHLHITLCSGKIYKSCGRLSLASPPQESFSPTRLPCHHHSR